MKNEALTAMGIKAAKAFLTRRCYRVEATRRWKTHQGADGIIAIGDSVVIFAEVNAVLNADDYPDERITDDTRRRFEKVSTDYIKESGLTDVDLRYDIISINILDPSRACIRHHINALL